MRRKDRAHRWVQGIEKIWDFYFELFGQRQVELRGLAAELRSHRDGLLPGRIYGAWQARPIPAPPPFCYMRTGFAPATFRRGIPLRRLGKQLNPFPLVQLPYHRLVNPWTLGAMLHEISHNLQSDLGLSRDIPRNIARRLLAANLPPNGRRSMGALESRDVRRHVCAVAGWPQMVASLMDVVGRAPERFSPSAQRGRIPHPICGP